jgi:hypothetical protein
VRIHKFPADIRTENTTGMKRECREEQILCGTIFWYQVVNASLERFQLITALGNSNLAKFYCSSVCNSRVAGMRWWSEQIIHHRWMAFISPMSGGSNLCFPMFYNWKSYTRHCRSQRKRGLSHEMSSPARTLGSWVTIPLKAWMSLFILCLCYVAALRRADLPSKESYRLS